MNASDQEDLNNWEIHPMVKHLNFDDPEFEPSDNCYAESKPAAHPSTWINKKFVDSET